MRSVLARHSRSGTFFRLGKAKAFGLCVWTGGLVGFRCNKTKNGTHQKTTLPQINPDGFCNCVWWGMFAETGNMLTRLHATCVTPKTCEESKGRFCRTCLQQGDCPQHSPKRFHCGSGNLLLETSKKASRQASFSTSQKSCDLWSYSKG